jgi:ATP-binding cassette, subfamily B, bacterial
VKLRTSKQTKHVHSGQEGPVSASEELLFGGPLRYEMGFANHEDAFFDLNIRGMVRRLPRMLGSAVRLAWQADRRAARIVAGAELGQGIARAVSLVAINHVLSALLATAPVTDRLRTAVPALIVVAVIAALTALLSAASTYGTGKLEPTVERVATEQFLQRAARVELAAIEDDEFHKLLDSAQYGATSARRMIKYSTSVINALLALIAAAGVLTVLHPLLLPLLVTMTLPQAWAALSIARRRYRSFHAWVQHQRASHQFRTLLTNPSAAGEIRMHGVGDFLLTHFRGMSETYEVEQARLARLAARTGLIASAWTALATAATYLTLGGLLWSGAMALSVAGTAVVALRTGSSSLDALVLQVNYLHEEALFVADLDRLNHEAGRREIPTGGAPLPNTPERITVEDLTFTYPGSDTPALEEVSLTIPTGSIVALVGENGSGKSTLVKLLAGLYTPDSGRIRWDEVDTAQADRYELFSRIAAVTQDFYRWPFTAGTNIAIGRPEAEVTQQRLQSAAAHSGADEVIAELPRGWKTLLVRGFKGGHEISGGMWQKIGIARARYRQAPILIVDEPTAALDARAEVKVFDQIRRWAEDGQTIILITHRLASVRHADLVHVLDHGRLAETGTPDQLLAHGGIYRQLYDLQAAQFQSPVPQQAAAAETADDQRDTAP